MEQLSREARGRYEVLLADREGIDRTFALGAEQVRERGSAILTRVRAAVGVGPR